MEPLIGAPSVVGATPHLRGHQEPPSAGARRAGRHAPGLVLRGFTGLAWLGLGAACVVLDPLSPDGWGRDGTMALSVLATLFGSWVFWRHGGSRITAVGVYNIAFALFVGFGGVYHAMKASTIDPGVPLFTVAAVCYFVQVTTWLLFWSGESPSRPLPDAARADARTAGWAVTYGCVLLVFAVATSILASEPVPLIDSAGFVGVLLLGAGLLRGPLGKWTVFCGAVVAVAFAIYFVYLFSGFGRIVIGTLALGLLVILAHRNRQRLTKAVILLGAAPVLLFLAGLRAVDPGDPGFTADPDGFRSAVSPIYSFAELLRLDAEGLLPQEWGTTFFNASVALIPRALWADKPVGFGTDLVWFLSPEMVGTGHSEAALWHGEWFFNFGLLGLALMIPVTGLAVRGVDRLLAWASRRPLTTPHAMAAYVAAVLATVGLFDLVWVGAFTYMARTGGRLVVLAVLVMAVGWLSLRSAVQKVGTGPAFDDRTRRSAARLVSAAPGSGRRRS